MSKKDGGLKEEIKGLIVNELGRLLSQINSRMPKIESSQDAFFLAGTFYMIQFVKETMSKYASEDILWEFIESNAIAYRQNIDTYFAEVSHRFDDNDKWLAVLGSFPRNKKSGPVWEKYSNDVRKTFNLCRKILEVMQQD